MLVLSVTDCPPALRGDLSRWLMEIDTGVYVGHVSKRVREELWKRITGHLKNGRAILVFTAANEQKMDFRVHNASWEPIDFDGLKLMLRPGAARMASRQPSETLKPGYSRAAHMRMARLHNRQKAAPPGLPERFALIDLETTGLKPGAHQIIEVGAIRIQGGQEESHFHSLIWPVRSLPAEIQALTGIDEDTLRHVGRPLEAVLPDFLGFLEDLPLCSHHIAFDMDFLRHACSLVKAPVPLNQRIDTLSLARRYVREAGDYRLTSLMEHFGLEYPNPHRSLSDCRATFHLLCKLIEIRDNPV